jgi:U6 snRNA-associated Sm-like protein LSm8
MTFSSVDTVSIITSDGRNFIGTLKGFDQTINIILDDSHERVYSLSQGVEQVVLGLYIIRGDNIAIIGEVDQETDKQIDFSNLKANAIKSIIH